MKTIKIIKPASEKERRRLLGQSWLLSPLCFLLLPSSCPVGIWKTECVSDCEAASFHTCFHTRFHTRFHTCFHTRFHTRFHTHFHTHFHTGFHTGFLSCAAYVRCWAIATRGATNAMITYTTITEKFNVQGACMIYVNSSSLLLSGFLKQGLIW